MVYISALLGNYNSANKSESSQLMFAPLYQSYIHIVRQSFSNLYSIILRNGSRQVSNVHKWVDEADRLPIADDNTTLINVFVAFQIAGASIWLLILLTAAFSSQVVRHPTWFSFCLSWITWGVSFLLLFFAGQQRSSTPQRTVCVAQAALVYAMPPL